MYKYLLALLLVLCMPVHALDLSWSVNESGPYAPLADADLPQGDVYIKADNLSISSVHSVQWTVDGSWSGNDNSAPYIYVFSGAGGSHTFRADAVESGSWQVRDMESVTFTVGQGPPPPPPPPTDDAQVSFVTYKVVTYPDSPNAVCRIYDPDELYTRESVAANGHIWIDNVAQDQSLKHEGADMFTNGCSNACFGL